MASYQNIDTRLAVLEDMLAFVMNTARIKYAVTSGLTDAHGKALPSKVYEGSLLEAYRLSRSLPTVTQDAAEPPPLAPDGPTTAQDAPGRDEKELG